MANIQASADHPRTTNKPFPTLRSKVVDRLFRKATPFQMRTNGDDLIEVYVGGKLVTRIDYDTGRDVGDVVVETPKFSTEAEFKAYCVASAHESADNFAGPGLCYFIGGDEGPIKIGTSVRPQERLKTIQACSPVKLELLALREGGALRESAYHQQFDEHRSHFEWFHRHPDILAEIARLSLSPSEGRAA